MTQAERCCPQGNITFPCMLWPKVYLCPPSVGAGVGHCAVQNPDLQSPHSFPWNSGSLLGSKDSFRAPEPEQRWASGCQEGCPTANSIKYIKGHGGEDCILMGILDCLSGLLGLSQRHPLPLWSHSNICGGGGGGRFAKASPQPVAQSQINSAGLSLRASECIHPDGRGASTPTEGSRRCWTGSAGPVNACPSGQLWPIKQGTNYSQDLGDAPTLGSGP